MGNYNTTKFVNDLEKMNVNLSDKQIDQFMIYYEMLVERNQYVNLTAITEFEEVMKKHFVDSVSLIMAYDVKKKSSVIDVGTGAGFPGLALKIAFPELRITLLDSLNKRIQFLNDVIRELHLEGIETIHGRAEDFSKPDMLREKFDLCVSRAVANLSTLSEYCLPYVKENGIFISYKSEKVSDEIKTAGKAISILGGNIENQIEFMLPDSNIYRNLIIIRKISATPKKYPRKAGLPSKEPL